MSDEFKVHRLNENGLKKAEEIAHAFDRLLTTFDSETVCGVPAGRERALVVTKLQEACFFAKRAIALQPKFQEGYAPHRLAVDQDETYCRNERCTDHRSPVCDGRQP